jgi:aminoglycoside phosphotransferase (APT) family kinase protein
MMNRKFQSKIKLAILFLFLAILPSFSNAGESSVEEISPSIMNKVKTAIYECLKPNVEESFQVKLLTGGYSATSVRIDFANKSYVLRIIKESESLRRVNTELYAMKKAAEIGVAPPIHWISPDGHSILMDYIPGGTLTIEYSKKTEIIANVACLMRKIHGLPKNPFSAPPFKEHMEKFYLEHSKGSNNLEIWEAAISIIREGSLELEKLESPSVNTHGDLSPRNILMTSQTLYFIDWSEEMYTEPFHDLGYFSILMDYSSCEDDLLLNSYLLRQATTNEKKRFLVAKKMNFGRLALGGLYIGNKLSIAKEEDNTSHELKEWPYYAKSFASNDENLSSQFFWNLAKVAIQSANAIDIDTVN